MRWLDGITNLMDMSLSKLVVGDGQRSLVCCSPWGRKEWDTTEGLNSLIQPAGLGPGGPALWGSVYQRSHGRPDPE